jgi:AraC-like DNA-binding protein
VTSSRTTRSWAERHVAWRRRDDSPGAIRPLCSRGVLIHPGTFRGLCRARDLLVDVDGPALPLPAVARAAAISPYHFIRQFHALFGVTPHQMRIQARLDRARELLQRDRASVTDVCLEVGFSSVGSFSSLFTRRIGTSPSAYRRTQVQVPADLVSAIPGCLGLLARLPIRNFRDAPRA